MLASLFVLTVVLAPTPASASVEGLDGAIHRPLIEAMGKPIALVFIAHDCPICNAYAPELLRIAKVYGRQGVPVELVYAEPRLSLEAARAHARSYSYTGLKIFLDPKGSLAKACGVTITPEAAVFDAAGRLTYRGRIDNQYVSFGKQRTSVTSRDLRSALDATLMHKQVAHARTEAVGCFITASSG